MRARGAPTRTASQMALRWPSADHEHSYCRRGEEPAFETDRLRFDGRGDCHYPPRPAGRRAEAGAACGGADCRSRHRWLRARRVRGTMPKTDARKLVSEMRYDGEKSAFISVAIP